MRPLQNYKRHQSMILYFNTIGVQADNNVINGEDFISENTPLTINIFVFSVNYYSAN
jgi:hypothetical protein